MDQESKEIILDLIRQIRESKEKWLDKYFIHTVAKDIEKRYKDTPSWKSLLAVWLPALNKSRVSTWEKVHYNLTHSDFEIAAQDIIWVHLLTESLVQEFAKYKGYETKDLSKLENLIPFMKTHGILLNGEGKKFSLSKEMRNCYVHNSSMVSPAFWKLYKLCNDGTECPYKIGEILLPRVDWIEKWHDEIFVKIAERIEMKV